MHCFLTNKTPPSACLLLQAHNIPVIPGMAWTSQCEGGVTVIAAQLQHRLPCWGYVFQEAPSQGQPGRKVVLLGDTCDSQAITGTPCSDMSSSWVQPCNAITDSICPQRQPAPFSCGKSVWFSCVRLNQCIVFVSWRIAIMILHFTQPDVAVASLRPSP